MSSTQLAPSECTRYYDYMTRPKKNLNIRKAMCERFVGAMDKLDLSPQELSQLLGYSTPATISKVQRGEAFVDIERLALFSKLKTPQGAHIDLNWLINGDDSPIKEQSTLPIKYFQDNLAALKIAEPTPAYAALERVSDLCHGENSSENRLIHGDNLSALKLLADASPGSVKCAYLDPPYNNGESYLHYYDSMGHDEWLLAISKRLQLIKRLLKEDGSLWISIDDSEIHYLKVEADKIFGRENFVGTVIWERRTTRENRKAFSRNHEYLLVYSKNLALWSKTRNTLPLTEETKSRYKNPDNDPRGPWQSISANVQDGHATPQQFYSFKSPGGRIHHPPKGRCWVYSESKMLEEVAKNNIWFGKDGNGVPRIKKFLSERKDGLTPETLWRAHEVGTTSDAKKQLLALFKETTLFDTPKPEQLIYKVLHISTNPGDLVLDPYLGSGTTAAVAHKMGRSYIGIENGQHIVSHCVHRLQQVINGEQGGVSSMLNWKGSGGFEFYRVKS